MPEPLTVIVPAHNETAVIAQSVRALLHADLPAGVDRTIIVVPNGADDDTAAKATAAAGGDTRVVVHEIERASKIAAIRAGAALAAPTGPVAVVDADVELRGNALGSLYAAVQVRPESVASPRQLVDCSRSTWPVRRYYQVWLSLPYAQTGLIGAGAVMLGSQARTYLDQLPDVTSDDGWIRRRVPPTNRVIAGGLSVVHAARTTRALLARRARVAAGNAELDAEFGERDQGRNRLTSVLDGLRRRRFSVLDAVVFATLTTVGKVMAARRRHTGTVSWGTDTASRYERT